MYANNTANTGSSSNIAVVSTTGKRCAATVSTKEVQPTDAGRVLLQLYQIFARLEQAIQVTQRIDQGKMGQLVVGSTSSIAYDILSTILQNFRENFPEVELVLQELTTTQQEQALRIAVSRLALVTRPSMTAA